MSKRNKKVFLTGGTAGIGRALLLLMAEKGYHIFAIGRDAEKKADLSTDIRERQLEAQIHIHLLDLADTSALEKELPEIWAEHGPFDILINNAALGFDGVEGKSMAEIAYLVNTNLTAYLYLSGFFLERMAEARSEEHTSELQSRENLVCRLLLEKKKNSITVLRVPKAQRNVERNGAGKTLAEEVPS